MKTALVGEISSYKAIVISRFLKKQYPNLRVVTFDTKAFTKLAKTKYSDAHFIVNDSTDSSYVQQLSAYVNEHQIDYFFPVHSSRIGIVLESKHLFGNSLNYTGNFQTYLYLHNKANLIKLCAETNVPLPISYSSVDAAVLPFVIKPPNMSSSKGVHYVFTEEQRKKHRISPSDSIIQQFISGSGCGFSAYVKEGKIISASGHMRLAEYPISGGSSVYRGNFEHPDMRKYAEQILQKVKWSGFIMFEFKLDAAGKLYLIEINPRIWGSINQGLQNNCNYFEGIIDATPVGTMQNKPINTFLGPQVFLAFFQYLLRGNTRPIKQFLNAEARNKGDIGVFTDFGAFISNMLRIVWK